MTRLNDPKCLPTAPDIRWLSGYELHRRSASANSSTAAVILSRCEFIDRIPRTIV
jgi:hypothetical protein